MKDINPLKIVLVGKKNKRKNSFGKQLINFVKTLMQPSISM